MRTSTRRTAGRSLLVALVALMALPATALAHPLGNLSSNSAADLRVSGDQIAVAWVLDLAEIPAFQARQDMGEDEAVEDPAAASALDWADERCTSAGTSLRLSVDDDRLDLDRDGEARLDFLPGEAGLTTLRLECDFTADADLRTGAIVTFEDAGDLGRAGWREVTASGVDLTLSADVPETSTTDHLREYPTDVAPLRVTTATLTIGSNAAGTSLEADDDGLDPVTRAIEGFTSSLTDLVAREDFTAPFALLAFFLAIALGAIHALAPGHGKTVMAAYLVSRRGTTRQAIGLGLTTAVTHTIGVLILGTILSVTQAFAPADLYPWLGLSSGLLFAAVGLVLLRRSILNRGHEHGTGPGQHTHGHDHTHDHAHAHDHAHDHAHEPTEEAGPLTTWRGMVLPGLAGGMVPSPSALVVLVGGIALGRAWFGVLLVAAYGIGMAATLVAAGYALTRARGWMEDRAGRSGRLAAVARVLPAATAAIVVLGGVALTVRSLGAIL